MLSNSSQAPRGTDTGGAAVAVEMAGLGNRFLGLLGRKWSRRAFAAEMAKLVAQATRARATAILGFQRRGGTLVLLADHGLAEEARAALAGGKHGAWDIPLRGLQNRRISVIEAAHQNPFVPRALTNFSPNGLCIVSLPVYYDYEPVGVVLLFAARARAFPDTQLQTLSQALRVCGRGLRERELPSARGPVPTGAPVAPSAGVAAETAPEAAETEPQTAKRPTPALHLIDTQPAEQPAAPLSSEAQRVEQELARAQAEMQRRNDAVRSLTTSMRALRAERDRLAQQLTELEYLRTTETTDLRTQLGQIEERLLAAESERVRYQRAAEAKRVRAEEALNTLQTEHDGLLERLRFLESSSSEARTEYDRLAAQNTALAGDLEASREELEQARAADNRSRADLEAERGQWRTQASASETRLAEQAQVIAALRHDFESVVQARDLLVADLASARAEAGRSAAAATELRARVAQADVEREAAGAENARLRETLDETHSGLVARTHELQAALTSTTAALRQREAEVERAATQQQQWAAAQEDLARQLAAAQAQAKERAAAVTDLHQQLAEHQQTLVQREQQLLALRTQVDGNVSERLHAEQALESARTENAALTQNSLTLRAQLSEQQELLARFRHERAEAGQAESTWQETAASLRSEVAKLTAQLEQAHVEHEQITEAARAEQLRLQTKLQQLADEYRNLESQRATGIAEAAAQREALTQLQSAFVEANNERQRISAQARQLTTDLKASRQQVAERESQLEAAGAECRQLQEAIRQAEARAASAAAQTDELRQTVREAMERLEKDRLGHASEIESLLEESGAPITRLATDTPAESAAADASEPIPGEDMEPTPEQPLIIERSAPLAASAAEAAEISEPPEPEPAAQPAAASVGELVLLDEGATGEQARAALDAAGFQVSAMAPGDAAVDELARRKLKCIMLNLAAGAIAWHTLKLLRERLATRNVPVLAYVMAPNAPMGFCFGRTDFALWPLEPGRLIERLGRLRPKLQRLLAITADVDGMGRLREPLARAKISTSIVLDAKQVLDFATMVDPEAAILHLSPTCPSSARAILALRANSPTRDLPLLILLDKSASLEEEAFLSQASQQLLGKAGFRFSRLPEEIGRLIG